MKKPYSDEQNVLILLAVFKAHRITRVVASPGSANSSFVVSLQNDPDFEVYSAVDERSAAYMACGLADETGEPVVITCTGATASRNYLPAMTEAYYRKLPILAVTATQEISKVGHHLAQVIDRSQMPTDTYITSMELPVIKDDEDRWNCEIRANKAVLELTRNGGGPVHLNLPTTLGNFNKVERLPDVRVIRRIMSYNEYPKVSCKKIAIFIGSHRKFSLELTRAVELFCDKTGAVVFCDHTSNYSGKNRVQLSLIVSQVHLIKMPYRPELMIHIGEVTGDYSIYKIGAPEIWRVSEDGEVRDTFRSLSYVFQMREIDFFSHYQNASNGSDLEYYNIFKHKEEELRSQIPDMPLSNVWIGSKLAHRIPEKSTVHFAILNSLRSWNLFEMPKSVNVASNVGGFGIDGNLSSLIGASWAFPDRLFYCIIGDLAFFYDMNALGNRHVGRNIRILLINNGKGAEFLTYKHRNTALGKDAEDYVAAAGHFGCKSKSLVKHYAQDLGFNYMAASSKKEFMEVEKCFLNPNVGEKALVFEVYTDSDDEHEAQLRISNIIKETNKGNAKVFAKKVLGEGNISRIKRFVGES